MNDASEPVTGALDSALLDALASMDVREALSELTARGRVDAEAAMHLAEAALTRAERAPATAARWVEIGATLNQRLGDVPSLQAQLSYAQARVYVQLGQLTLAETALRAAQAAYETIDDRIALARSYLGLTQILAMQGRYNDAESAGLQAIFQLQAAVNSNPEHTLQLAGAHRNLATLLVYQEKHHGALEEYERAQQILQRRISALGSQTPANNDLWRELAHVNLNQATALMFVDRTYEAEAALQTAINIFDRIADVLDRGRARTNLGSLYLRTGRYAAALTHFESAARDLIGDVTMTETIPPEHLHNADILLLDQANVYLALNLVTEATNTLNHCVDYFRSAGLPYELGQALVARGLVSMRINDEQGAEVALLEAERLFIGLRNLYWQNRTAIALATLEYQRGAWLRAANRLDALLARRNTDAESTGVVEWDIGTLVDAHLLRLRVHLQRGEIDAARQMAAETAAALGLPATDLAGLPTQQMALPQFVLRLHHALGEIARAAGDREQAQRHFRTAITLLESQRASLPVEEIRTSFLDDKTNLYSDLVLSLLEDPDMTTIAEAFAMVERARSRALLERLLASMAGEGVDETDDVAARRADLQQQLHLLYNRLLGETGSRYATLDIGAAIRQREALLQQLDWRDQAPLPEAQPVDLTALQQAMPADQQAIVFFIAGAEIMAFVISQREVHVQRHLCSVIDLVQAKAEWRFQLGRAEMDNDYMSRHAERFERGWRNALAQIYNLLLAPLMERLTASRLLLIPYGSLHLLPLHALWDGRHFLLEHFECAYAPSASVAVRVLGRQTQHGPYRSWAGLAVTDPTIPAARAEVEAAASLFPQAWLYLDEAANQAGLAAAAQQGDILHLATHGLFRPDNPFFSVLKLADGWVDVRSIYRLSLAARLVVLSACESGAAQVRSGDEVIGLARGFLALGAQSLLVSLWNVHDASSANLMKRFYDHLVSHGRNMRPAAALRAAQLEVIEENPHPYYWAPYFMIGG